jgi:hypothetical protein
MLVVFAALVCNRTVYSAVLLTANYSISASALDQDYAISQGPPFTGAGVNVVGGVTNDVNPGPFLFEPDAEAVHGESIAVMHAAVRAEVGRIGVGMVGGAASSEFLGPGRSGKAEVEVINANAGWLEFIVPRVRNKAVGQSFIYNTLVVLEGNMAANVSPGDVNGVSTFGQAHAFLEFYEDSLNSTLPDPPYGGTPASPGFYYADIVEAPGSGLHIFEIESPVAIHVRHVMQNGLSYTLANRMRLHGDANAANGGSSIITANFSNSLKWGGVESVTDMLGNPIPREDWAIESESGFDYSRSFDEQVPEPSSLRLLTTALCGLSWFRKNRVVRNQFRGELKGAGVVSRRIGSRPLHFVSSR